jgi:hypothetical protein
VSPAPIEALEGGGGNGGPATGWWRGDRGTASAAGDRREEGRGRLLHAEEETRSCGCP